MSVQHAIFGYLSWQPLSGYDLKKLIADSDPPRRLPSTARVTSTRCSPARG